MDRLTVSALLAGAGRSFARSAGVSLLVLALLTAGGVLIDLTGAAGIGNVAFNLASLVAELMVLRRALAAAGLADAARGGGVLPLFGLGLVSGLAILLGFLLLILPGWWLAIRWSVAAPVMVGEQRAIGEAMRDSWRRTRGHVVAIGVAELLAFVPVAAGIVLGVLFERGPEPYLGFDIASNLLLCLGLVAGWHLTVATYLQLGGAAAPLAEVFA